VYDTGSSEVRLFVQSLGPVRRIARGLTTLNK
jgi:hypothetical protein